MKYLNIFLIAALLLIGVSCDDNLDINPEQDLDTALAFSTEATTRAMLLGAYSGCQDLDVFGAMPQIINDYQADNVNFVGSFPTLIDIDNFQTLTDNTSVANIYRDHYTAILGANAVIAFTDGVDDLSFSDDEKSKVIGEAKFIRALLYWNLVNLFGQPYTLDNGGSLGVPLILEPTLLTGAELFANRSTVAEVYGSIEADLNDAINRLPDAADRVRATKGAAQALASRVALYKGENSLAASLANDVINSGNYTLAADYSFYDAATPEDVFTIDMSEIDNSRTGSGGWASFYNPAEAGARGDCPFSQDLLDAYDDNDLRMTQLMQFNADSTFIYTTKFPDAATNSDNAPIIRITEMYLNRAEALAKMNGVNDESLMLINTLRQRAGLDDLAGEDFGSDDSFVDAILIERRKELAFEGHRRMDLLRNGKELREGDVNTAPGATRVILPIPQREIDLGSSLPQSPGY